MNRSAIQLISAVILFVIIGSFIYSNTLNVPFVFDDLKRIRHNPYIRINELTPHNLVKASSNIESSVSRPIGNISFALNYFFHQYNLPGYHVVNISIHILAAIFLYLFIKITFRTPALESKYNHPDTIAFLAALLWLVHPLNTQSVTYIVQRLNSMAAMFYVLSFFLYATGRLTPNHRKKWIWYVCSTFSWIMALGSKQTAATLPFFVFLYEWYFFQDLSRDWLKRHRKYFFAITILFALVALIYLGGNPLERITRVKDYANQEFTLSERVLTQFRVVVYYITLSVYPHPSRLNLDYDFPLSHSLTDPVTTLFSLFIIIGFVGLSVYMAKNERLISFCIFWFFGNLVIESSVIPLAIIFEHRTYLPLMFICLIPTILTFRYIRPKWSRLAIMGVALIVLSLWTYQRNNLWNNPVAFWQDCVNKSPNKARPHINLADALSIQDRTGKASSDYKKLKQTEALDQQNRIDEAIKHYKIALSINPNFNVAQNNLGFLLYKRGHKEEAIKRYKEALRIRPDFDLGHNNMGFAMYEQGRIDEAIEHYQQALRKSPDYVEANYNLAIALDKQGRIDEAIEHYTHAVRVKPDFEKAYNNLGIDFARKGDIKGAIAYFQKALEINPNHVAAKNNLSKLLMIQQQNQ